jgi:EpsI family protein
MNGVRIAGIISLAHWGGPTLNIVDNHLWYGWGFFTLVLFLAGYMGSYVADGESDASSNKEVELHGRDVAPNPRRMVIAGLLSILVVASVFVAAEGINSHPVPPSSDASPTLAGVPGWHNVRWLGDWDPAFSNADFQIQQSYARDDATVDLFVAAYSRQGLGRKMISYDNHIIDQAQWSVVRERRTAINLGTKAFPFVELVVASGDRRRYVWLFYWVDGTFTANPVVAKLLEVKAKLFLGDPRAAIVAISTSASAQGHADLALQSFLQEALSPTKALLETTIPLASTLPAER